MPKLPETLSIENGTNEFHKYETVYFCSNVCHNQFADRILQFNLHEFVLTDVKNVDTNIVNAWNKAIAGLASDNYNFKVKWACESHSMTNPAFPWWDLKTNKHLLLYTKFYKKGKLTLAENLEKCGRTEDAAIIYETLQMYNKSKELRDTKTNIVLKNTNISLNVNTLLQQLKDGGIVAVYRCPYCGGKLKVNKETTLSALNHCEHCGSEISAMDLADFLKTVLN